MLESSSTSFGKLQLRTRCSTNLCQETMLSAATNCVSIVRIQHSQKGRDVRDGSLLFFFVDEGRFAEYQHLDFPWFCINWLIFPHLPLNSHHKPTSTSLQKLQLRTWRCSTTGHRPSNKLRIEQSLKKLISCVVTCCKFPCRLKLLKGLLRVKQRWWTAH